MRSKLHKLASVGTTIVGGVALSTSTVYANAIGTIEEQTGFASDMGSLISSVLSIVIVIALLLVLFYLILGGIAWITAGGDKGKTEEARNKITAAVVGIIILAAAWALVQFVAYILGFENLQGALDNITRINDGK